MIRTGIRSVGHSPIAGFGFQLDGGVGDLELLCQHLIDGRQHGPGVCRFGVVDNVRAKACLGSAHCPDMQFMDGGHPWQIRQCLL